jgi:hypothetical protein
MALVIIGLLVGGMLVGRDRIRAAELRSIVSDREKYVTAINADRLKYNAKPGGHNTAEQFFGASNTDNGKRVRWPAALPETHRRLLLYSH